MKINRKSSGDKPTIRNHFLPVFYLKYFIDTSLNGVWVYDIKESERSPQTRKPDRIGAEKYLYSVKRDGWIDDRLEPIFGIFESKTRPIFDRWQYPGVHISDYEKEIVAIFISYMATRVPRSINTIQELGNAFADQVNHRLAHSPKHFESALAYLNSTDEFANLTRVEFRSQISNAPEMEMNKYKALESSLDLAEDIHTEILNMHWSLCQSKGLCFVTGDAPMVAWLEPDHKDVVRGNILGSNDVDVTFPISPSVCLRMNRKKNQHRARANDKFVKAINRRTVGLAERFVYSSINARSIQMLVRDHYLSMNDTRKSWHLYLERSGLIDDIILGRQDC
jgi:hypothetical protein